MWENKNVYGNVCGNFPQTFYFPTFLPKNKTVYGNFPIDICAKECGKIKMSMEMSMETFPRHFYFPTFLPKNKNVCGNFPFTLVGRNVGK
jgi:hypothetical protein